MVHFDFVATPWKWWLVCFVGGFVPWTSERMLGFPKCELVKMLIWITLWELLARVESHPASVGRWQVKQTLFYQIVSHSFQGSPSEERHVKFHELITSALRCFSLLKILTPYWFPMAFQKRKDTFNTSHEEPVIWYHQELKAIKVRISNPIAAKCLLVRSHLLTVFRCV